MARRLRTPKADAPYPPGWEPFLAAIRAETSDDTVRLVFADWLQENGDEERAELIRLQCALSGAVSDDPDDADRSGRENELLHDNWYRWTVGFPRWLRNDRFNHPFVRGFIAEVSMTASRFTRDGDAVTRLTAVENLNLTRTTPDVLQSPLLARVGGLYLDPIDSARVDALAGNPHLSAIRYLCIGTGRDSRGRPPSYHISGGAFRRLLLNPSLARLKQFVLNGPLHGNVVAFSLEAERFASLEQLDLLHSRLTAEGVKAIVNSASAGTLRGLYLAGNPFGDDGIRHLVEAPALCRVESLNLIRCGLTPESARSLAGWPGLRTVKWLQLRFNDITPADADVILNSPHAVALTKEELGV